MICQYPMMFPFTIVLPYVILEVNRTRDEHKDIRIRKGI